MENKILENVSINKLLKAYEKVEKNKLKYKEYQQKNKEKVNAISKKHYDKLKENPEEYKKLRQKKKEYYQRKKLENI